MTLAVSNTTLLSNFAHLRRPDLPSLAFPELIVPTAVLDELKEGERLGSVPSFDWGAIPVVEPEPSDLQTIGSLRPSLDWGETACLAIAIARKAIVVTDDWDARQVAASLGLEVSGTLGALCLLIEQRRLTVDTADQFLLEMIAKGYRSPLRSITQLLESRSRDA